MLVETARAHTQILQQLWWYPRLGKHMAVSGPRSGKRHRLSIPGNCTTGESPRSGRHLSHKAVVPGLAGGLGVWLLFASGGWSLLFGAGLDVLRAGHVRGLVSSSQEAFDLDQGHPVWPRLGPRPRPGMGRF
jgi:hypothetical protein